MKRTKLSQRTLPVYTAAEEITNTVSHAIGVGLGLAVLYLCVLQALRTELALTVAAAAVYGASMTALYAMSSIYHGLKPGTAKKVLQVLDHCSIYFLIAGTYTPIVLVAIAPLYPTIGWGLFAGEWLLAALATTLTAIDLKRYRVFSMVCYIGMGWGVILFLPQAMEALTAPGFWLLFAGGVVYTVGAVLFGLGKKIRWMHPAFHVFVLAGSFLQFLSIIGYVFP